MAESIQVRPDIYEKHASLFGDKTVNGRTVNVLVNSRYREKGSTEEIPLRSGKIQVQSEAAECHYRRMFIRPLRSWPDEIAKDVPARSGR